MQAHYDYDEINNFLAGPREPSFDYLSLYRWAVCNNYLNIVSTILSFPWFNPGSDIVWLAGVGLSTEMLWLLRSHPIWGRYYHGLGYRHPGISGVIPHHGISFSHPYPIPSDGFKGAPLIMRGRK